MKTIETLVDDIHNLLDGKNPLENLPEGLAERFGERMAQVAQTRVLTRTERVPRLSPSNIGKPCTRQLWYSINQSDKGEKLNPIVRLKFLYGDITEELLLFLAEAAGHTVQGRQDRVEIEGIWGNRDAIIDGTLVDVKSASTYGFVKFRDGTLVSDDPFGYIGQIQTYLAASQEDPLVTDKDRCAFFVMDKGLGHICVDIHPRVEFDVREITRQKIALVNSPEVPPRRWDTIPDGYVNKSTGKFMPNGNEKLAPGCSYCEFKHHCWDGLRTFLYSGKVVHLAKVEKEPKVPELKKDEIVTIE